jgi:magnesium-transporting ATPase (P-type)
MFEIFYLFNFRYVTEPVFSWKGFTSNRYVLYAITLLVVFQLGFTYLHLMQTLFGTTVIGLNICLMIVSVSVSVLFLVELEKFILRLRMTRKGVNEL